MADMKRIKLSLAFYRAKRAIKDLETAIKYFDAVSVEDGWRIYDALALLKIKVAEAEANSKGKS